MPEPTNGFWSKLGPIVIPVFLGLTMGLSTWTLKSLVVVREHQVRHEERLTQLSKLADLGGNEDKSILKTVAELRRFMEAGDRFTAEQGAALERRVDAVDTRDRAALLLLSRLANICQEDDQAVRRRLLTRLILEAEALRDQ